jgi:hypothetical protein
LRIRLLHESDVGGGGPCLVDGTRADRLRPACPEGYAWNGAQCLAVQVDPAAPPSGTGSCASIVLAKGYSPETVRFCRGVHPRCARAVLDRGYAVATLPFCERADPTCAEAAIARGDHVSHLPSCVGIDGECAAALIARGYGPEALDNCKRRRR